MVGRDLTLSIAVVRIKNILFIKLSKLVTFKFQI